MQGRGVGFATYGGNVKNRKGLSGRFRRRWKLILNWVSKIKKKDGNVGLDSSG
jgi:hypothetical protein